MKFLNKNKNDLDIIIKKLEKIDEGVATLYKMFDVLSSSINSREKCTLARITHDRLVGVYCSIHDVNAVLRDPGRMKHSMQYSLEKQKSEYMTEKLKNCPFCGKIPFFTMDQEPDDEKPEYKIECECALLPGTHWKDSREEVIKIWNTRAEVKDER